MNKHDNLKVLESLSVGYLERHKDNGGTSESDPSINWISKEKLRTFNAINGQCWLVKVNRYTDEDKCQPYLVQYKGQRILRGYGLAVKQFDQQLSNLLEEYDNIPAMSIPPEDVTDKISKIFNRAQEVGCIYLQWV